jgi:hypothetical protein
MSTRTVRPGPRRRPLGRAAVIVAVMIAAATGFSGGANAQTDPSGQGAAGRPAEEEGRKDTQDPAAMDDVDYELLLGRLLSNSKSRQFLAELEVRLRRGDSREASGFLLEALEAGTVAALIMDRVESPGLLAFLQTLEKPQPRDGASAGAPPAVGSNGDTRLKELEKALESETNRANAAQRELDALRTDLAAREVDNAGRSTELQDIVQRTKERVAAATRDRDTLMEQLAAARADGVEKAALQRELEQERERADAAGRDRDALREQLASLRDGSRNEAELAASAEKARAEAASAALDAERSALAASKAKLIEAHDAMERERKQAEQARSELDGLKTELRQDAEKSLRLHEALAQEKRRADAAAQELGSMKAQVDALRQSEAKLAEVSAVAEGERRRAEAAALEEAVLKGEQAKLRSKVTELEGIAKREKQRADAALRELAAGQARLAAADAREATPPSTPAASQGPGAETSIASARPASASPAAPSDSLSRPAMNRNAGAEASRASVPLPALSDPAAPLVDRADALLKRHDVGGARLLLERAVQAGSARAMFLLAQSYDPRMLAQWRIAGGVTGDEAKARELYAAAQAAGYHGLTNSREPAEKTHRPRSDAGAPLDLEAVRSGRPAVLPKPRPKEPPSAPSGRTSGKVEQSGKRDAALHPARRRDVAGSPRSAGAIGDRARDARARNADARREFPSIADGLAGTDEGPVGLPTGLLPLPWAF